MSLYLGKIGRQILNFTVTHPRLNRAVDVFSKTAHEATLIKEAGLPIKFQRKDEDTPESVAKYCRHEFIDTSRSFFNLFFDFDRTGPHQLYRRTMAAARRNLLTGSFCMAAGFFTINYASGLKTTYEKFSLLNPIYSDDVDLLNAYILDASFFFPIGLMLLVGGIKYILAAKKITAQNSSRLDFSLMKNTLFSMVSFSTWLIYPTMLIIEPSTNYSEHTSYLMGIFSMAESLFWGITFMGINCQLAKWLMVNPLKKISILFKTKQ